MRDGARTLVVELSPTALGVGFHRYWWRVSTGIGCRDRMGVCGDNAPGRGRWIRSSSVPAPRIPSPIAGQGYKYIFGDEFAIFDSEIWSRGPFWDGPGPRSDIYARDGMLQIVSRRELGYPDRAVETRDSRSFRRGYFEARMRWTRADATAPAIYLFSANWARTARCPPLVAELDIFERTGASTRGHNGALHRNTTGPCGIPDEFNENSYTGDVGVDLSSGFHTYAALWTDRGVVWYLDERELKRAPVYDSTDQDMFIHIDVSRGRWATDAPTSDTPELRIEVDWIRVWQG